MDKWIIATVLYVALLTGGFSMYDAVNPDNHQAIAEGNHSSSAEHQSADSHTDTEVHQEANRGGHGHESNSQHTGSSEVQAYVQSDQNELKIFLRDKAGNPVSELEVNHEKLLHLIIVDETLHKYYHVHPEQTGQGEFRIANQLPPGFYKAFIDIKPKQLAYHVSPIPFIVGNPNGKAHGHGLAPDQTFTQTVEGETATMQMSATKTNQPVTLKFDLDKSNLTPYLGAMGHVVILDENAQKFLHVHPANQEEPIFETQFEQPGIYKIWAEFKQNGKVRAFSYVVEIKGEE